MNAGATRRVFSDTAAPASGAEAPSSMPAMKEIPLVLSVNPPWKLKSAAGLVGSAERLIFRSVLFSVTGPTAKFPTVASAVRVGYGRTATLPSTCTGTPVSYTHLRAHETDS